MIKALTPQSLRRASNSLEEWHVEGIFGFEQTYLFFIYLHPVMPDKYHKAYDRWILHKPRKKVTKAEQQRRSTSITIENASKTASVKAKKKNGN